MKLRIIVDSIPSESTGGASSATNQLLSHLRKCQNIELINEPNVHSRALRLFDKFLTSSFLREMSSTNLSLFTNYERLVQKLDPDIVFYLNPTNNAKFLCHSPFFTTIWDLGHIELSWLGEFTKRRWNQETENRLRNNLYRAKLVVVDSKDTAVKVAQIYGIPMSRFLVIPFVPRDEFLDYRRQKANVRKQYAIYPANFWEHKNHVTLFRAMKQLIDTGKTPVRLILTGYNTGFGEDLERMIESLNLKEFVEIRNFIPLKELIELYVGAKLTVYPSLLGPTNIPPLESLSLGTPVYASEESVKSIQSMGLKGMKLLPAKDIAEWASVLEQGFNPIRVNTIQNRNILTRTKENNFRKIKSVIDEEYNNLLR